MSEFTPFEQQKLSKQLKTNDQMLFNSQFDSVKQNPNTVLILSVIFGTLGVDRFMLGDVVRLMIDEQKHLIEQLQKFVTS